MSDLDLLKYAAKAANYPVEGFSYHVSKGMRWVDADNEFVRFWNPLIDDGDALRLAVVLQIGIGKYDNYVSAGQLGPTGIEVTIWDHQEPDAYAAMRRAIVTVAAKIGRSRYEFPA